MAEGGGKSKTMAIVLAVLLGGWGVDCFYLGHTNRGILRIVLTFVTCGIGSLILMIIDVINYATDKAKDADGNPLV